MWTRKESILPFGRTRPEEAQRGTSLAWAEQCPALVCWDLVSLILARSLHSDHISSSLSHLVLAAPAGWVSFQAREGVLGELAPIWVSVQQG